MTEIAYQGGEIAGVSQAPFSPYNTRVAQIKAEAELSSLISPVLEQHKDVLYPRNAVLGLVRGWVNGHTDQTILFEEHGGLQPHPELPSIYECKNTGRIALLGYGQHSGHLILLKPHNVSRGRVALNFLRGHVPQTYLDIDISSRTIATY